MPTGADRECRQPLCRAIAVRNGLCSEHASRQAQRPGFIRDDPRLSTLTTSNKRFRRARHSFLVRHPVCNDCKREPANVLDHVVPHRGVPALFWDQANWQGLCVTCHGRKTAREVWGGGAVTAASRVKIP